MFRKKVIAGNWKMNKTATEAVTLAKDIIDEVGRETSVDIVLCPPFTALSAVAHVLEGQAVKLGGQNMHPAKNGAYTGEISAEMLRTLYATHVILGHSERRTYFCETDAFINQKVVTALAHELKPILCVGETLAEREAGATLAVVQRHVEGGLSGVKPEQITTVIIAYEPVWAIGTGEVATPEDAQEVCGAIRGRVLETFGADVAAAVRILYGGSVKSSNVASIMAKPDVDGALIGGASLDPDEFVGIVRFRLHPPELVS